MSTAEDTLKGFRLDKDQLKNLTAKSIDTAAATAERYLGKDVFASLDEKRQAEIVVGAYQSPGALFNARHDLAKHIQAKDWAGLASRFEKIGRDLGDPSRYQAGAEILRDPELKGKIEVKPGDNPGILARRHGVDERELMRFNGISDPTALRAGTYLRLPPKQEQKTPASQPEAKPEEDKRPGDQSSLWRPDPPGPLDKDVQDWTPRDAAKALLDKDYGRPDRMDGPELAQRVGDYYRRPDAGDVSGAVTRGALGSRAGSWEPLKEDGWIGPKTTEGFPGWRPPPRPTTWSAPGPPIFGRIGRETETPPDFDQGIRGYRAQRNRVSTPV